MTVLGSSNSEPSIPLAGFGGCSIVHTFEEMNRRLLKGGSQGAALAEGKNADAYADGPDGCQQPHARESRTQKGREIVRVRKDSTSRAEERSDSGCPGEAGCCRFRFHGKEDSATF